MGYEIDYLAVGEGEKSGDAIAIRYGNLHGPREEQTVITIDGGTLESGDALVEFIQTHYKTSVVDYAFLTHPDSDHASGMRQVIEKLRVGTVLMHRPWNHSADVKALVDDDRVTSDSLRERAKKNLSAAREIEQISLRKGIRIVEPFAGIGNGNDLLVLGPTEGFYQNALANFKFMPGTEAKQQASRLQSALRAAKATLVRWVSENWFAETLQEPEVDATSAENNSSTILLLSVEGKQLLFTGDAGVPALERALDFANTQGVALTNITFFDVPHHGSRRNIGPNVLNRLFGCTKITDSQVWTAFISAAKEGGPKHPHKKVTNALRRRGGSVCVTSGQNICHFHDAPTRDGYYPIQTLPLYCQVEDDD